MRTGTVRWVGAFSLTFGLLAALGQDACTTFGAGSEAPDASSPIQDGGPPPPPPNEASLETAPTLVIDKTAELRRGGSVVVKLTVGGARKDEGPANLEAEFSPKLDGVTFGAMNVDVAAGTGTIEIKATATAKTAPTDLKVRVVLRGGRSTGTGVTKLDVFGKPGELDDTFGDGGIALGTVPGMEVSSASIDSSGNVYVGGMLRKTNPFRDVPYVTKYDASGKLVPAFGTQGVQELPTTDNVSGLVGGIHARNDGVVAINVSANLAGPPPAGIAAMTSASHWRLRAFRDTTFTFALTTTQIPDVGDGWQAFPYDAVTRVAPGGWGMERGRTYGVPGEPVDFVETSTHDFVVGNRGRTSGGYFAVRLGKDGKVDPGFATAGRAELGSADTMAAYGAAAGANGYIYVCGAIDPTFKLIRFRASDGSLDVAYGTKNLDAEALRTEILPQGFLATEEGMYALGSARNYDGSGWAFVLAKFNLDGTVATEFGKGGVLHRRAAPATSFINYGMVLLNPGSHRLLLIGYHKHPDQGAQGVSLARIWR